MTQIRQMTTDFLSYQRKSAQSACRPGDLRSKQKNRTLMTQIRQMTTDFPISENQHNLRVAPATCVQNLYLRSNP